MQRASGVLTLEEIGAFAARSNLIGAALVLRAWAVIFVAMTLFARCGYRDVLARASSALAAAPGRTQRPGAAQPI